jgi:hypothetical protein
MMEPKYEIAFPQGKLLISIKYQDRQIKNRNEKNKGSPTYVCINIQIQTDLNKALSNSNQRDYVPWHASK